MKVVLSITNIDCKMTTKEVKDLKHFADRFAQYHRDLEEQVLEELVKIRLEAQFRQSIARNNRNQFAETLSGQNHQRTDFFQVVKKEIDEASLSDSGSLRRQTSTQSFKSFKEEGSSDDEFFDAYGVEVQLATITVRHFCLMNQEAAASHA